jgi:hypothetical protein
MRRDRADGTITIHTYIHTYIHPFLVDIGSSDIYAHSIMERAYKYGDMFIVMATS